MKKLCLCKFLKNRVTIALNCKNCFNKCDCEVLGNVATVEYIS